jgi:hypothetical protein
VRGLSSGREMLWKRRTAASKQDHRAAVERVLRPGVVLQVRTGAGSGGNDVAAGGGSGRSWRAQKRAAGKGNRAGAGGERRVEVDPAGGGAAAAAERRLGAGHCAGGKRSRAEEHVLEEEEREGVWGACLKILEILGTSR